MNMDFFKGGNLQFNNMNDFMNQKKKEEMILKMIW
jgi:hypothetical protein